MANKKINKQIEKIIALFMICLVLTLPLFSANTLAATVKIHEVVYSGDAGVKGMLDGKSDSLHLEVIASKDQGETKKSEIVINFDNKQINADSCELSDEITNQYVCKYDSPKKTFAPISLPLKVRLWDSSIAEVLATVEKTVLVDAAAPTVVFDIPLGVKDKFNLKYSITDKACTGVGCENQCVGLFKLFVTINGQIIQEKDFTVDDSAGSAGSTEPNDNSNSNSDSICSFSFNEEKNIADLPLDSGNNEICILVSDKFGNIAGDKTKGVCKSLIIDSLAPVFDEASFTILDAETKLPVNFRKASLYPVNIKLNIVDDQSAIKTANVKADFFQLNPSAIQLKSISPNVCTSSKLDSANGVQLTLSECIWNNIMISPNLPSDSIVITINAVDLSKNNAVFTKTINLPKDDQNPKVEKISAITSSGLESHFFESQFLHKGKNNITAIIDEQGSGLFNKNVYLTIFGKEKKADNCVFDGSWICIFENILVNQNTNTGDKIIATINAEKSTDDVGNQFSDKNNKQQLIYDGDAPVFKTITLKPNGVERDTLLLGQIDIVNINVTIEEKGVGLNSENVYVDVSGFDPSLEGDASKLKAIDCIIQTDGIADIDDEQIENFASSEDLYECSFEYAGTIANNDLQIEVIAEDLAGNIKKSNDDYIFGKATAVGTKEKKADNWKDEIEAKTNNMNRNILWMTDGGTILRAEVEIEKNPGKKSYAHSFRLGTCYGQLDTEKRLNASIPVEFSEVDYIFPETSPLNQASGKTKKLILLTLPQMDKAILSGPKLPNGQENTAKASQKFIVKCDGAITQSSSKKTDLYSPDELFALTVTVPFDLSSNIYNPGTAGLDKIHEKEKFIEVARDIADVIGAISDFLEKICKPANDIYQIINNICIIINSVAIIAGSLVPPLIAADSNCKLTSDYVDWLWTGEKTTADWNEKAIFSMGYICDLVLCTSCSEQWGSNFLPKLGEKSKGTDSLNNVFGIPTPIGKLGPNLANQMPSLGDTVKKPGESPNLGTFNVGLNFDPKQSLLTALICSPPCLPTIKNKLEAMKLIYVTNNVCKNLAYKTGDNFDQCDRLEYKQWCEFIVSEFWYLVPNIINQLGTKWVSYFIEKFFFNSLGGCEVDFVGVNGLCTAKRVEIAISTLLKIIETGSYFESLADAFGSVEDAADNPDDLEDEAEKKFAEDYGTIPDY